MNELTLRVHFSWETRENNKERKTTREQRHRSDCPIFRKSTWSDLLTAQKDFKTLYAHQFCLFIAYRDNSEEVLLRKSIPNKRLAAYPVSCFHLPFSGFSPLASFRFLVALISWCKVERFNSVAQKTPKKNSRTRRLKMSPPSLVQSRCQSFRDRHASRTQPVPRLAQGHSYEIVICIG